MKAKHRATKSSPSLPEPDMETIEERTKVFAEARANLTSRVTLAETELGVLKRKHLPDIRRLVGEAAAAEADLHAAVAARRDLFTRPKTRILHGIRVGWVKGKGKLTYPDPQRVVKAVRKHMPRKFKTLVKVSETPVKPALSKLSAAELKKLGVSVGSVADVVTIAPVDSAVDKIVDALMDGARPDGEDA